MKGKNKKIKNIILGVVILLVVCLVGYFIYVIGSNIYENNMKKNLKDFDWVSDHVEISSNNTYGESIYSVSKHERIDVWNMNYQKAIDEKLNDVINDTYTLEYPFIIYNPYGTNNLGINIYFNTEEDMEISYIVSVGDEDIPNYSNTLNNDVSGNYTKEHAYQIIGLVPGKKNVIDLVGKTKDGEEITSTIFFDATNITRDARKENIENIFLLLYKDEIELICEGDDEVEAMTAMLKVIEDGLGE